MIDCVGVGVAPLFRYQTAGQNSEWLVLTIHHLIFDGHSLDMILSAVGAACCSDAPAAALARPQLMSYREWVAQERSESLADAELYWSQQLAPVRAVNLIDASAGPPSASSFSARSVNVMDKESTELFTAFASEHAVTLVRDQHALLQ